MGHEVSGYIDEAGEGVDLEATGLKVGDPIMVLHNRGCTKCKLCIMGCFNYCLDPECVWLHVGVGSVYQGGFQTHLSLPLANIKKIPKGLPMETATMMSCSVGTTFGAIMKIRNAVEFAKVNINRNH